MIDRATIQTTCDDIAREFHPLKIDATLKSRIWTKNLPKTQCSCEVILRKATFEGGVKIVLFGSYAYGKPTEDSDADLLVVMDIPEDETRRQAVAIRQRIPRRFRMDLIVRTPSELAFRVAHNDWFHREILERGTVLYESADAGVGAKS